MVQARIWASIAHEALREMSSLATRSSRGKVDNFETKTTSLAAIPRLRP